MGKIYTSMSYDILDPNRAVLGLRAAHCGAEILFLGTVRNENDGQPVQAVNYDGHIVLGEKILHDICIEAQKVESTNQDLNFWVSIV
ncbi:MAG: molybdenum cofactor biosynthesis protein MoaE [Bdellovibrionales bacterium]|nr:molybdenum cofactor biosynthesis protein MoaE [Bdellovibrionales bacterium]